MHVFKSVKIGYLDYTKHTGMSVFSPWLNSKEKGSKFETLHVIIYLCDIQIVC